MVRSHPGRSLVITTVSPTHANSAIWVCTDSILRINCIYNCHTKVSRNMPVMRPWNNQETWTHRLYMIIPTINSGGTFSHKTQMGDMWLWQNYDCKYVYGPNRPSCTLQLYLNQIISFGKLMLSRLRNGQVTLKISYAMVNFRIAYFLLFAIVPPWNIFKPSIFIHLLMSIYILNNSKMSQELYFWHIFLFFTLP